MATGPQCFRAARVVFWVWAWLAGMAHAQPVASTHLQIDLGVGHESQTSPLFQVAPDSTIIYQDDVDRLSGTHVRTALQGSVEWLWSDGLMVSLSGSTMLKRSPTTPGFDLTLPSIQPTVHLPIGRASLGIGLNFQSLDVAGQHFRDSTGLQADWTLLDGQYLWGMIVERGVQKHSEGLTDMDAEASSLTLITQISKPVSWADGVDFSLIFGREKNTRGFGDLSNHSTMFSALLRWSWAGVKWSAGRSWRQARFDEAIFPGEPPRDDRTSILDLAAEWELSPARTIRAEFNETRNASNSRLYENIYHQVVVTVRQSF
jgi:hypothetical protein